MPTEDFSTEKRRTAQNEAEHRIFNPMFSVTKVKIVLASESLVWLLSVFF